MTNGLGMRSRDSCGVPGCNKDHRLHHCRNCGAQNNHKTSRCPLGCGVRGCNKRHRVHYCDNCGAQNRHMTTDCPNKIRSCSVPGCTKNHSVHICGMCGVQNDHRTGNCPYVRSTRRFGATTVSSGPNVTVRIGSGQSSRGIVFPGGVIFSVRT